MSRLLLKSTLVLFILAFFFIGCGDSTRIPTREYGNEKISVDGPTKSYMLNAARSMLTGISPEPVAPQTVTTPYSKEVFICLFLPGQKYIMGNGSAGNLANSLKEAVGKIKTQGDFKRTFSQNMDKVRISVHIMTRAELLKERDPKKLKRMIEPGVAGLFMIYNNKIYFQMAEEVLWKSWGMKGEKRVLGTKMVKKQMGELAKQAGLSPKTGWQEKIIYRFFTTSFIDAKPGGKGLLDLFRGNVLLQKNLTRGRLLEAAASGGRNLAKGISGSGKYSYLYYPGADRLDKAYNIVRHAGTTYSLFQIYKATGDPEFKNAGLKALKFIEDYINVPEQHPDISLLTFKNRSDLGSNALLTLALLEMPDSLLKENPKYRELLDRLGAALLAFQMEDGSFYKKYKEVKKQTPPKKQPIYYPGETFLAFVRFYEKTKEQKYLDAAVKAANYQIDDFEKTGIPDNWAIQAYSRMYRQKPNDKYAKACFDMADELLTHQYGTFKTGKVPQPDFFGGFDNSRPPRSTPAASRTEAITEAYDLAAFRQNRAQVERYGKAIMAAYWFILNQQYREENSYWLKAPHRAMGGIKGSPIANDIRIDYTQHTITAILHGLHVGEKANGKGAGNPQLGIFDVLAGEISLKEAETKILDMGNMEKNP